MVDWIVYELEYNPPIQKQSNLTFSTIYAHRYTFSISLNNIKLIFDVLMQLINLAELMKFFI